jgi:hypothetical protein
MAIELDSLIDASGISLSIYKCKSECTKEGQLSYLHCLPSVRFSFSVSLMKQTETDTAFALPFFKRKQGT